MRKAFYRVKILFLLVSFVLILPVNGQTTSAAAYEGKLIVGKRNSAIIYYGEESGDLAAFCFINKSKVGRAILSKCKNGEQCEFDGQISLSADSCNTAYNWAKSRKLGGFSQSAKIVSLKSVRKVRTKK